MTSPFTAPTNNTKASQALREIDSRKVSYANKDFVRNISWLNQSVDTLSQYTQKLEAGVNQANMNALEKIGAIWGDLFILFAGGEPTGIDIGDIKYIIQGIGAFFGINPDTPFPLNLFEAAQHMLSQFFIPLEQFTDVIFDAIEAWAIDFGFSPAFMEAIGELEDAIVSLGSGLGEFFDSLKGLLGIFGPGPDWGPIGAFWDAIWNLLDNINTHALKPVIATLADLGIPFIKALTFLISMPEKIIGLIPISHLTNQWQELLIAPTMDYLESIEGGNVWTYDETEGHTDPGSVKTTAAGTKRELISNTFTVVPGQKVNISVWCKWSGLSYSGTPFKLQVRRYKISKSGNVVTRTPVGVDDVALPSSPGTNSGGNWVKLGGDDYTVPSNTDEMAVQLTVTETAVAGTIWWDDASAKKTGLLAVDWVAGLANTLANLGARAQEIIEGIWEGIFGPIEAGIEHTIEQIKGALRNIPPINIGGLGGLQNMAETIIETWNSLWGGLARALGIGKGLSDAANAASVLSEQSDLALQLSEWNNAVMNIRNNKPLWEGMDETSESNFLITELFTDNTTPPKMIPATSSSVPISFWRATEDATKGFISWYGVGITNVSGLYIDIYKFNFETNILQLIHTSPNQIGQFEDNTTWQMGIYYIPENQRINVAHGEIYGVAWRVSGTGTHNIAGKSAGSWFPPDTTTIPQKPAATRTGYGNLPFGSITYANNIAWFGIGIVEGDNPEPYHAPRTTEITLVGTNIPYTIPVWANVLDISLCPGGGGGHGGHGGDSRAGDAGDAGSWVGERLVRGVDFPAETTTLYFDVGGGGAAGPKETPGGNGGNTVRRAITGGKAALTAYGGAGGGGYNPIGSQDDYVGGSPGNFTNAGGNLIRGGQGGNGGKPGYDGGTPGGGGGGGDGGWFTIAWAGGKGGRGMVHIVARQSA